jgi:hypothetical protein
MKYSEKKSIKIEVYVIRDGTFGKPFKIAIAHCRKLAKRLHNMIHNLTPTQQNQFQRALILKDRCCCCKQEIKTLLHIITCPC